MADDEIAQFGGCYFHPRQGQRVQVPPGRRPEVLFEVHGRKLRSLKTEMQCAQLRRLYEATSKSGERIDEVKSVREDAVVAT